MRSDMAKVIVERPRTGGDGGKSVPVKGYKKARDKMSLDEQPVREPMMRPYGHDTKNLNEHLTPLRRFLRKNVGRPWDKVWSEICKNIRITSAVQSHVRDHADQYVAKNVVMRGKVAVSASREWLWQEFYVNPRTGLLCYQERERFKRSKGANKDVLQGDHAHHQYRRLDGIWYEVVFEDLPKLPEPVYEYPKRTVAISGTYRSNHTMLTRKQVGGWDGKFNDALHGRMLSRQELKDHYGIEVRAVSKLQLNKRRIKQLGLNGV